MIFLFTSLFRTTFKWTDYGVISVRTIIYAAYRMKIEGTQILAPDWLRDIIHVHSRYSVDQSYCSKKCECETIWLVVISQMCTFYNMSSDTNFKKNKKNTQFSLVGTIWIINTSYRRDSNTKKIMIPTRIELVTTRLKAVRSTCLS